MGRTTPTVVLFFAALSMSGCTVIGTGRNADVLARPSAGSSDWVHFSDHIDPEADPATGRNPYPHVVVTSPLPTSSDANSFNERWARFREAHREGNRSLVMNASVRDQTSTPPLDGANIDVSNAGDIAKIMSDTSTTNEKKDQLIAQLRDNYRQLPESLAPYVARQETWALTDLATRTSTLLPVRVYHYFPRLTLDLSAQLTNADLFNALDEVTIVVRLHSQPADAGPAALCKNAPRQKCGIPRIINFSPKAADLFDYTIGSLKQDASVTAAANLGHGTSNSTTNSSTPAAGSTVSQVVGGTGTNGASLSATASDSFTKDLKYSLDARSPGIDDGGGTFYVTLKANEQKRIAGTYSYELMLEIPSVASLSTATSDGTSYVVSDPVNASVNADIRLIGAIRHVLKAGKTGTLKRVPASQNDDTVREWVVRDVTNVPIWTFSQPSAIDVEARKTDLIVYTNAAAASFTVYKGARTEEVVTRGSGQEAHLWLARAGQYTIVFDPINQLGGNTLTAPTRQVSILSDLKEPAKVVSNYLPQSTTGGRAPAGGPKGAGGVIGKSTKPK